MDSAQYNLRVLLVMTATCCMAFAVFAQHPNDYVAFAAAMVPLFWTGLAVALLGNALEQRGERWLMIAVTTGVIGTLVCVMSVFTGLYYTMIAIVI